MSNPRLTSLMIVDDDRRFGQMLAWAFEDLGYRITLAAKLSEARMRFQERSFDGLLLDFHLPDGTALDLLSELQGRGRDLAIFVMSAALDEDWRSSEPWWMVRGCFAKPIAVAAVDKAVQRAVRGGDVLAVVG